MVQLFALSCFRWGKRWRDEGLLCVMSVKCVCFGAFGANKSYDGSIFSNEVKFAISRSKYFEWPMGKRLKQTRRTKSFSK